MVPTLQYPALLWHIRDLARRMAVLESKLKAQRGWWKMTEPPETGKEVSLGSARS